MSDESGEKEQVDVLVSGFEVFGSHSVNPSWEVMKEFDGCQIGGANISAKLLPVCYEGVDKHYPKILEELPALKLIVNCGVGHRQKLKVETRCRNGPYFRLDNKSTFPPTQCCNEAVEMDQEYNSSLPLDQVVEACTKESPDLILETSNDAGLYLCEYTYYHSLQSGKCPAVFLHVPPYDHPYSHEQLKQHVELILTKLIACVS
eukprot:m.46662 g.46662  ORF g.46662 m.46662 type:complete len:204 (+) comp10732_c0_seq1:41-652(+)